MGENPSYTASSPIEFYLVAIACIIEPINAKKRDQLVAGAKSVSERGKQSATLNSPLKFSVSGALTEKWLRENLMLDSRHAAFLSEAKQLEMDGRNLASVTIVVQNMLQAFRADSPFGLKKASGPLITKNADLRITPTKDRNKLGETSMRVLWARYKDVAHLVAAFVICTQRQLAGSEREILLNDAFLSDFKNIADGVRRDLIRSVPLRSKIPNINPSSSIAIRLD